MDWAISEVGLSVPTVLVTYVVIFILAAIAVKL